MKRNPFFFAIVIAFAVMATFDAVAQTPKLNDAEIASVAVTANQIDIDYAKIAVAKSKNDQVVSFAKTMMADHQAVIDQAVALVTKLKVTPMDNDVSKKLNADAEATEQKQQRNGDDGRQTALQRSRDPCTDQAAGDRTSGPGRRRVRPQVEQAEDGSTERHRADKQPASLPRSRHLPEHVDAE